MLNVDFTQPLLCAVMSSPALIDLFMLSILPTVNLTNVLKHSLGQVPNIIIFFFVKFSYVDSENKLAYEVMRPANCVFGY
jgi:hypothetical protein